MLTSITGINWGDEGKGRMVDLLSQNYDIVARYQGGDNAGHTVKNERGKFVLNLIPSGILRPDVVCVMGGGMVIDPEHLEKEIASLTEKGVEISPKNLKISDRATITMPFHVAQDGLEEERLSKTGAQFGSTKRGIAYSYGDKYMKKTLRMGDLVHMDAGVKKRLETIVESKNLTMVNIYGQKPVSVDEMWAWCEKYSKLFAPYICDVGDYLDKADREGKKIMFEAQLGALRDIDFGIYPYTSSSNTVSAYAPIGAGIPGHKLNLSIGIMKAYSSCVGEGPFTTELAMTEAEKDMLREHGHEYGAATGRPRRVGPFDAVASRYGVQCQGCDELALTLLDVLDYMEQVPIVTAYKLTDGTTTTRFPMGKTLDDAQPVVETVPGWHCDITGVRKFEDLPKAAQDYVKRLEELVGCKSNGNDTVVEVKVGDTVRNWNGLGVQLTSVFHLTQDPVQPAGYEYLGVRVTTVNRSKTESYAIGAQGIDAINEAYPVPPLENVDANFQAMAAATPDFTAVCDGQPAACCANISLYNANSQSFSDVESLPPQGSAYIVLMLMVPKDWKQLKVTYVPTFLEGKSLTFVMNASDVIRS